MILHEVSCDIDINSIHNGAYLHRKAFSVLWSRTERVSWRVCEFSNQTISFGRIDVL